nr:unnamed protein product [Digitaria exilis]
MEKTSPWLSGRGRGRRQGEETEPGDGLAGPAPSRLPGPSALAHQGTDDAADGDIIGEAAAVAMDEEAIEPDFATVLPEIDKFLTAYRDGEVLLAISEETIIGPAAPRRCTPAPSTTGGCGDGDGDAEEPFPAETMERLRTMAEAKLAARYETEFTEVFLDAAAAELILCFVQRKSDNIWI